MHHGVMNQNNADLATRFLPGVDLALWLRLVLFAMLAIVAVITGVFAF